MPNTFDENPFTTPQKIIKETIELINQTYNWCIYNRLLLNIL